MAQSPSQTELDRFARQNLRRNFAALAGVFGMFQAGLSFASFTTVLPALAVRLGASNAAIGLIPAIQMVGWSLPGILVANYVEGLNRKLPHVIRYAVFERLPLALLAIVVFLFAASNPIATLIFLFLSLAMMALVGGIVLPAWFGVITKIVPVNIRGRFFAWTNTIGAGLGLLASAAVGFLINSFPYPLSYVSCLAFASACLWIGFVFLFRVREPELRTDRVSTSLREYIARLPTILRGDVDLSRFLVARLVASLGTMGVGFYAVYALNDLKLAEWQMGAFNFILLATQMVSSVVFGTLADRFGHKIVITVGTGSLGIASLAAVLSSEVWWLIYLAFVAVGATYATMGVSVFNILLEYAPSGQQPTYTALAGLLLSPTTFAAPIIGGLLADAVGYQAMFWLSTAISLVAVFLFIFYVRDPRDLRAEPPFCPGDEPAIE